MKELKKKKEKMKTKFEIEQKESKFGLVWDSKLLDTDNKLLVIYKLSYYGHINCVIGQIESNYPNRGYTSKLIDHTVKALEQVVQDQNLKFQHIVSLNSQAKKLTNAFLRNGYTPNKTLLFRDYGS